MDATLRWHWGCPDLSNNCKEPQDRRNSFCLTCCLFLCLWTRQSHDNQWPCFPTISSVNSNLHTLNTFHRKTLDKRIIPSEFWLNAVTVQPWSEPQEICLIAFVSTCCWDSVLVVLSAKVRASATVRFSRSLCVRDCWFALQAGALREQLCKGLYNRLFTWIVSRINGCLSYSSSNSRSFYGILDLYGFENFEVGRLVNSLSFAHPLLRIARIFALFYFSFFLPLARCVFYSWKISFFDKDFGAASRPSCIYRDYTKAKF